MRDIKNVIEELKFIKKELPFVKEVFIQDDTMPIGRIREFANAILKNNLKITWSGYCRANIDYETLKIAKKSGCRLFHVGYESANQEILDRANKGIRISQMEKFTKDAKKARIKIHGDFIIGLPGETKKTILQTFKWAKKINIPDYQFVIPQPHPGTPLYEWAVKNNFLNKQGKISYPHLTAKDLEYWRFYIYRKLYLTPKYIYSHIIKSIKEPRELKRLIRLGWQVMPKLLSSTKIFGKIKKITDKRDRKKITKKDVEKQFQLEKRLKETIEKDGSTESFNKTYNEFHKYILNHGYPTEGRKQDDALHLPETYINFSEEIIYKLIPKNKKVLDIGIGDGRLCIKLAENKNNEVYGIDISDYSIKAANSKKKPNLKLYFQKADARKLPFPDNSFDYVTSKDLLEHLPGKDHIKYLKETKRILKNNGVCLVYTPPLLAYKKLEGLHLKQYKNKDLYKLLKSVFKKVEIYSVHLAFLGLRIKVPKLLMNFIYIYENFLEKTKLYKTLNRFNKFLIFRGVFKATK